MPSNISTFDANQNTACLSHTDDNGVVSAYVVPIQNCTFEFGVYDDETNGFTYAFIRIQARLANGDVKEVFYTQDGNDPRVNNQYKNIATGFTSTEVYLIWPEICNSPIYNR